MTTSNDQPNDLDPVVSVSLVGRLSSLNLGGTESISRRLSLDKTDQATLAEVVKSLRNTMAGAVGRASRRTGNTYLTETTKAFTRTDDIMVTASATCISKGETRNA